VVDEKMGVYFTCDICGAREKGMPPGCGCEERAGFAQFQKLVNMKILKVTIKHDDYVQPVLFLQLQNEDGHIQNVELSTAQIQEEYVRCQPYVTEINEFPN
jgi:hypothetical protein